MGWVAALLIAVVGCGQGDLVPVAPAAGFDELALGWQPQPMAVAADILAEAEGTCRASSESQIPAQYRLRLVDARGARRVFMLFGDERGFAECELALGVRGFMPAGGGASGDAGGGARPLDIAMLSTTSSSGGGPGQDRSSVLGRAGEGVTDVRVAMFAGGEVRASVANGWFYAWWPSGSLRAVIRGYDELGNVLAEARP